MGLNLRKLKEKYDLLAMDVSAKTGELSSEDKKIVDIWTCIDTALTYEPAMQVEMLGLGRDNKYTCTRIYNSAIERLGWLLGDI